MGVTALDPSIAGQLAKELPAEDFRRIIRTFEQDLRRLAAELEQAARAADLDGYKRAAHSLAGAASSVGAFALERSARLAMDAAAGSDPTPVILAVRAQAQAALEELAQLARRARMP